MPNFDPVYFKDMMLLARINGWISDAVPTKNPHAIDRKKRQAMPHLLWRCRECGFERKGVYRAPRCGRCHLLGAFEQVMETTL